MREAAQYATQWAALLPLAGVALAGLVGRRVGWRLRLIAVAMALSAVADMLALPLYRTGVSNLWLTYALAPLQFGLLLAVVAPRTSRVAFPAFLVLVAVSLGRATWNVPENVVSVLAGGAVVGCLIAYQFGARYKWGLILYCAGTVPALLALAYIVTPPAGPAAPWTVEYTIAWAGYQAPRVLALLILAYAALAQPRMQTEVARGSSGHTGARHVRPARRDVPDARSRRVASIT